MRNSLPVTIFAAVMLLLACGSIWADNATTAYLMKVGDHFDVTYDEVNTIAAGSITADEVPVVFMFSEISGNAPSAILAQRESGLSWAKVAKKNNIHPGHLFVKLGNCQMPEYKNIMIKFHNQSLRNVVLDDFDIICLVNYKFVAAANKMTISDVVKHRTGRFKCSLSFVDTDNQIGKARRIDDAKKEMAKAEE